MEFMDYMFRAISSQDIDNVSRYLEKGYNLNKTFQDRNLLCHAAFSHCPAIVALLLRKGVDPNRLDIYNCTPLIYAIVEGDLEATKLLIEFGADPNHPDSAILTAIRRGKLECFKYLYEIYEGDKFQLFREACGNGNIDVVAFLLEKGIDITEENFSPSPLYEAVQSGNPKLVELLLENKINTEGNGGMKETPLFDAARKGHIETMKILLKYGADVNMGLKNQTPERVINNRVIKDPEVLRCLVEGGFDLNIKCSYNHSILFYALVTYPSTFVRFLLEKGANVNNGLPYISAPLHRAVTYRTELVSDLIEYGADINALDKDALTPLERAIVYENLQSAEILRKNGASLRKNMFNGNNIQLSERAISFALTCGVNPDLIRPVETVTRVRDILNGRKLMEYDVFEKVKMKAIIKTSYRRECQLSRLPKDILLLLCKESSII